VGAHGISFQNQKPQTESSNKPRRKGKQARRRRTPPMSDKEVNAQTGIQEKSGGTGNHRTAFRAA
jgi:hypothetical protein